MTPNTRRSRGAQSDSAAAFNAYSRVVQEHQQVPALWDEPERAQARTDAYMRFLELFEAGQ